MRLSSLTCLVLVVISATLSANALTPECPSVPGVYALNGSEWTVLPTAHLKKSKKRATIKMRDHITDVFEGNSSSILVASDTQFCASGIPPGAAFLLANARVTKNAREVGVGNFNPWKGDYNFDIDKEQQVAIKQVRAQTGAVMISTGRLTAGQYVLFLQQGTSLISTATAFDFGVH